jgi:hypothetical protein
MEFTSLEMTLRVAEHGAASTGASLATKLFFSV